MQHDKEKQLFTFTNRELGMLGLDPDGGNTYPDSQAPELLGKLSQVGHSEFEASLVDLRARGLDIVDPIDIDGVLDDALTMQGLYNGLLLAQAERQTPPTSPQNPAS